MITEEMLAQVGKIFKPHSFKGELAVSFDYDLGFDEIGKVPFFVKIDNIPVPFFAESLRGKLASNSFIKFRGIDDDSEASVLANKSLYMLKNDLASALGLRPEEIDSLEEDFIGFKVTLAHNKEFIGYVEDIEEGIEYDYLAVRKESDGSLMEIPFIEEFIESIEEPEGDRKGNISVALPEGFLEI